MAKKTFDIKGTLAAPVRPFSVEDIEAATRQIHQSPAGEEATAAKKAGRKAASGDTSTGQAAAKRGRQKANPASLKKEKQATGPVLQKRSRAARSADGEPLRKVRISVDVRPETHKRLKIKAIENDSDLMRYVEWLIEQDLAR